MKSKKTWLAAAAVAAASTGLLAPPALAEAITDPAGDFLPTYVGRRGGDLDVLSASVAFDGARFIIDSRQAAPVGTTPAGFYVWGVDRGQGPAPFGVITGPGGTYDASRVLFDSVLIIVPGGDSNVTLLPGRADPPTTAPVATPLAASNVIVSGNDLRVIVPAELLPSRGFAFDQYGFNLWPRDGLLPFNNAQISDFAPDNDVFRASRVPEPASLALLALGGALLGVARRPGRSRT